MVHFTVSPAGDWQTGCVWWEVAQSRFHVDLKLNFALKNNSMEFLPGPITQRINVMYESQMKWTWHHSKLAVEEASFFGRLRVVLLQLLIYTRWSSRRYKLGYHALMIGSTDWSVLIDQWPSAAKWGLRKLKPHADLGPVSISDKTSYCKISQSLEATRFVFRIVRSFWNLTGTSAAVLPTWLSNFKAIR